MPLPDVDDFDDDCGSTLVNFDSVEDPTTDLDAEFDNNTRYDVAMATHTQVRACATITLQSATAPTLVAHDSVWGNKPSVAPTLAWSATGVVTLTWPTTVSDGLSVPYGPNNHSVNFRFALRPNVRGSTPLFVQASITAPNQLTLYIFNAAGAANDGAGITLDVPVI